MMSGNDLMSDTSLYRHRRHDEGDDKVGPYILAREPRDRHALLQATSSSPMSCTRDIATLSSSEDRNSHMCSALETAAL